MPSNSDTLSELQRLLKFLRPVSCGRHSDIPAYLRWVRYKQQLWRFQSYDAPIIPFTPVILGEHTTPPRVRDSVLVGESIGHITRIDRANHEAHVWFHAENRPESYDLDLFETNRGKIRWIIH